MVRKTSPLVLLMRNLGFSIDADTGVVTTNADFAADYEDAQSQSFTVVATDATGNASAQQLVSVAINNLDEVAPTITSDAIALAINENSGAGQVVYTATADDSADTSEGVTFSLSGTDSAAFSINENSGEVTLTGDPDYEAQSEYSFTVIADDGVNDAVEQSVTLDINNLDEIAPTITSGEIAAVVYENSGAGQVVYTATADDSADISDGLTFSLSSDSDLALSIDPATGAVTLTADPDYETQSVYSFAVIATDAAGNESAEQSVTLMLSNVDEVAPTITSDASNTTSVNENSGAGQVVYTATASDTDFNGAQDITFSLADENLGFSIDADTGVVTTNADFAADYEDAQSQSFTVVATDATGNASAQQLVSVAINNLDEVAPTITSDASNTTSVNENSGAGQVVYTATAFDTDFNGAQDITFSLADENLGFSIDSDTGVVTTNADFAADYENAQSQSFTVVATDATGNASAQQLVSVAINNLDEVAPTITSDASNTTSVNENSGAGQVVYTATASDTDFNGAQDITFSLVDDSLGFSIDADTGVVTTNADFAADYEDAQSQSFTVVATDATGNASAQQLVSVAINNLDEVAPFIISSATANAIDENTGAGQVIYTAIANDSSDTSDGVTFSLSGVDAVAFTINADSGEVTLVADPNHETQSQYSFAVIATDAAGLASNSKSVTLEINDLDDAAPSITSGATATAIDEDSGLGQVIYTATADDSGDDVVDSPITFSLADGSDAALSIDASTGEVILSTDPDHETQSEYSFAVLATDAAGNVSNEQSVTLDINNLDEIAPSIDSGDTGTAVDENSGSGQLVYTATATDDADTSDGFSFSLTDDGLGFSIDSATGAVTTNNDFAANYEDAESQSFTVIATDAAGNSSEQVVSLAINNLDDAAPSITSGDTAVAINENSGSGQPVYTATAIDDADTSAGFSFSLADESLGFSINADTGVVTTNADFAADYENAQSQSFMVVARDVAGNSSEQLVSVAINNLDEIAPSITSGDTAVVFEDSSAGALVYRALVDDAADISAGVTFSLSTDSDSALIIDELTGEVILNEEPDFASQPNYSFTVIADDGVNQSQKAVTLSIVDVDEEAPVFTSLAAVAIDENIGENQIIYTAVTEDQSLVNYSLSEDSDASLNINSASGAVKLSTNPNHESQSEYSFTVIATDSAGNHSEQLVVVTINDLDDAAPAITSASIADTIDENSGTGQVIYTATADDSVDISDGVTFSLSSDSDTALIIDSSTGKVTLTTDPDHETQAIYSFAVIATDAAGNASNPKSVILEINDLDDAAPTITSGDTAVAVDENSGASQVIYTATASDSGDDVADSPISFSLSSDSDVALTIDSLTGEVTLSDDPDHEAQSSYSFAVIATDAAGNESQAQSVTLNINDLDDAAPTITSATTATAIDENSGAGQVVYTATADDSADVSDTPITFSLADGSDTALIIDSSTGEVTLTTDPDHEAQASYSFAVIATDAAGNESAGQSITIDINNLDEVPPVFTSSNSANVVEGNGLGDVVYTAVTEDRADISSGVVEYSFVQGDLLDPALEIDQTTGEVTLNEVADYEAKPSYTFTVIASDTINKSVAQQVTLNVINIDDTAPLITSEATASIDENSGAGLVVYQAVADDSADVSEGVSFSLLDETLGFTINSETGVVTTNNDFSADFEAQGGESQSFTVVATDVAGNSTEKQITVSINDIDESDPVITSGNTATSIDENTDSGQVVYSATSNEVDVLFSLSEDTDATLFAINSTSGAVTFKRSPDFEDQSSFSFEVIATDAAGNISETQPVTLSINNVDDRAPEFTSSTVGNAIDENSGAGQVVYTAVADDSADISAGVTFSLSGSDADAFSIDSTSGAVTLTADPDYEAQSAYSFTVIADDGVNDAVEQSVTLAVNNLDEIAPTITSADTAVAIDENSGAGQVVYTAVADDSADISAGVTFSLSGSDAEAFSIDADTGAVTLTADPDYEAQSAYSFTVIADDGVNDAVEQSVTLDINDHDEIAPTYYIS
jgi:acyl-coenzyme A thioesterase PaaI-like protein